MDGNGSEWMGTVVNGSGMAQNAGNGSECPNSFFPRRNYPSPELFPADLMSVGRNQGPQENPYSS